MHSLLNDILNFKYLDTLGTFGIKLFNFSKDVNHQHPDIDKVYDNFFSNDSLIASKIKEAIPLINFAKENNYNNILPALSKAVISRLPKTYKNIDSPINNKQNIRLLKSYDNIIKLRKNKPNKIINIDFICNSLNEFTWKQINNNFFIFDKNNNNEKINYINDKKKKIKKFTSLNCIMLKNRIEKELLDFQNKFTDNAFGYYNIRLIDLALVLSKVNGYNFDIDKKQILRDNKEYTPIIISTPNIEYSLNEDDLELLKSFDKEYPGFDHTLLLTSKEFNNNDDFSVLIGEKNGKCYFIKPLRIKEKFNFEKYYNKW